MHIARQFDAVPPLASGTSPLSILYVLGSFPVLSETFISNEIRAMRAQGHRVVPLELAPHTGACQPEDEPFRDETIALRSVPAWRALLATIANPARLHSAMQFARAQTGIRPRSLLLAGARVALAARQYGCSHLHAHFALPAAATAIVGAKLAGLTSSFTSHGHDVYGTPADLELKLRTADVAIAVCEDMRSDFLRMEPSANVRLVYCGTDPEKFRPAFDAPRNGRLLAIGRLVEQKGYDVLLAALAVIPPEDRPVIDVVGGGELDASLQRQAAALGVAGSINFLGPRPGTWIASEGPHYLGFVAPYCICANGDRDTGPIVVKEAMAMGLPVVATSLMGMKEFVTTEVGRQVPPRDVAMLAAGLRWLATMPEEDRRRMGVAGRYRVQTNYTMEDQASGLADAIRSVQ